MKAIISMLVLAACCVQLGAQANINERQANQQQRIKQGVQSGELTKREAYQLKMNQRHINRTEARYRADGHLSKGERARLNRMENKQSANINIQKHDSQDRH
jgi:hypothetical protein